LNKEPAIVDGLAGLAAVKSVDAVLKSIETGTSIKL
jgi:hypothetical protein